MEWRYYGINKYQLVATRNTVSIMVLRRGDKTVHRQENSLTSFLKTDQL